MNTHPIISVWGFTHQFEAVHAHGAGNIDKQFGVRLQKTLGKLWFDTLLNRRVTLIKMTRIPKIFHRYDELVFYLTKCLNIGMGDIGWTIEIYVAL